MNSSKSIVSSERLLKIRAAATLLGATIQTLRNWTNTGYMNAIIGKGGHCRYGNKKRDFKGSTMKNLSLNS